MASPDGVLLYRRFGFKGVGLCMDRECYVYKYVSGVKNSSREVCWTRETS